MLLSGYHCRGREEEEEGKEGKEEDHRKNCSQANYFRLTFFDISKVLILLNAIMTRRTSLKSSNSKTFTYCPNSDHLQLTAPQIVCQQPIIASPGLIYAVPMLIHPNVALPSRLHIGATESQIAERQLASNKDRKTDPNLDFKPPDNDPFRFYPVREKDGSYMQVNRRTIDSGDIGKVTWYCNDGTYYAVKN
ncbi:hypothetical protein GcM3_048027 [Golovinomyces cichoracearum]|uniref:Uncharacterized protein n=1 Tax=Golovinomyces cichoracearum TaxID=62708 RepID=A0A420J016_9PEZI|nr:hypothetical protein GcM3_048027 [Golovinomyces cichoracearum]